MILVQLRDFSSAELKSFSVVGHLSVRLSVRLYVRLSVSPSINWAQIITTRDIKLKSDMGCPQVTLMWHAKNQVNVTYEAYFTVQSSLFPCISMEEVLLSYAKAFKMESF